MHDNGPLVQHHRGKMQAWQQWGSVECFLEKLPLWPTHWHFHLELDIGAGRPQWNEWMIQACHLLIRQRIGRLWFLGVKKARRHHQTVTQSWKLKMNAVSCHPVSLCLVSMTEDLPAPWNAEWTHWTHLTGINPHLILLAKGYLSMRWMSPQRPDRWINNRNMRWIMKFTQPCWEVWNLNTMG